MGEAWPWALRASRGWPTAGGSESPTPEKRAGPVVLPGFAPALRGPRLVGALHRGSPGPPGRSTHSSADAGWARITPATGAARVPGLTVSESRKTLLPDGGRANLFPYSPVSDHDSNPWTPKYLPEETPMRVPTRDPSAVRPLLRRLVVPFSILLLLAPAALAQEAEAPAGPVLDSMSALAFGPGGVLFVGDARGGSVVAIETGDTTPGKVEARIGIVDLETRLAAMLGSRASEVLIHDLAVNPISQKIYLAVSRGRAKWESRWQLPNDLADAAVLVRIDASGELEAVELEGLAWSRAELPDPVDPSKAHRWKRGVSLRVDTITDLAFDGDSVWVTGLSNEEFASAEPESSKVESEVIKSPTDPLSEPIASSVGKTGNTVSNVTLNAAEVGDTLPAPSVECAVTE